MALTGLHHARAVNFKAKAFKPIAMHSTTRPVTIPALRSSAAARVLGGLASHAPGALIALTCQPVQRRHLCIPHAAETTIEGSPEPDVPPGLNLAKVASLGSLFFASTFCYTILQNLKDSIVVTSIGAEALPFLEAYGVLPLSLAFYVLYNKLNQRLPEKWVYQAALLPFLSYYALFGAVLWPLADKIHPTHLLEGLKAALPAGLVGLAGMVVNWSFSLFFVMGELWGGVAISLLFWGLADEVCTVREAESVYPLLGILANIGLVLSGAWIKTVNGWGSYLAQFGLQPVQALIATVLIVSMGLFAVKAFIHDTYVKPDPASPVRRRKGDKKKKSGKTITESLSVLKHSPKVGNLAILVISYFISQKLFDFAWKAQLRVMYPSPAAYQQILADVAQYTGMATIALMCTSKFVFRWGGWRAAALATPVTVLVSGAVFFASAIAMQGGANVFGPEVVGVLMAVGGVAGVVGRVASRAPKYSLFDPAKEMVYITMKKQEKLEGKAAVDLLGSYFGKSGASWIMQILVLTLGSLTKAMPIMALVHMVVGVAWTRSTFSLAAVMEKSQAEEEQKEREAAAAAAAAAEPPAANETGNGGSHVTSNGNGTDGNGLPSPAYVAISNGNSNGYTNGSGNGNGHAYSTNGNSNGSNPAVPFTTGPINANGSIPTTFKQPA